MTDIPTTATRIAHRSTRFGRKPRWTELAVYHDPGAALGRCWIAETLGCSTVPGERTRRDTLATNSLERTLQHFDDGRGLSAPARAVCEQARAWSELHAVYPGAPFDWEGFVGDAYQSLGAIAADLPGDSPVAGRVQQLLDVLADPQAAARG